MCVCVPAGQTLLSATWRAQTADNDIHAPIIDHNWLVNCQYHTAVSPATPRLPARPNQSLLLFVLSLWEGGGGETELALLVNILPETNVMKGKISLGNSMVKSLPPMCSHTMLLVPGM